MEHKKTKIILLISSVLLFFFYMYISNTFIARPKLEVGQVYKYVENDDNPFEEDIIHYQLVISIKGNFVLYYDSVFKDTVSDRKSIFLWDAELVK